MPPKQSKKKQEETLSGEKLDWTIPEDEQKRIIEQTGILGAKPSSLRQRGGPKKPLVELDEDDIKRGEPRIREIEIDGESSEEKEEGYEVEGKKEEEEEEEISLAEEVFIGIIWTAIFSFLHAGLDLAVHTQYSQELTFGQEMSRLRRVMPGLFLVLFFSLKYTSYKIVKLSLFLYSLIGGSYMVYIVNSSGYINVIQRSPILGVLWIWSIVQLDLIPAVVSLIGVAGFVWYKGLTIIR